MTLSLTNLRHWYEKNIDQIVADFFTFLRFKSISTDSNYAKEIHATAHWLCDYLETIGMDAALWETSGHPCVFATYLQAGPKRPTLLIYHHYDVQPVDPIQLWHSPPFEPVIKNDKVYARGASDNKGQCFYTITALKAVLSLAKEIGVNIKLFIEGEEESGGEGTVGVLPKKHKELKADYLLVVDSDLPKEGEPGITLGIRGMVAMEVECRNAQIDLHSGAHGGLALNPNRILVTLLSKLWDQSGKVTVPGFYDDVEIPSKEEMAKLDTEFDEGKYRHSFGVKVFGAEGGFSPIESNQIRPILEINGINGGYTGEGFKTVIPATAKAKISCRLVPHQDPKKIEQKVTEFLQSHVPKGVELNIKLHHAAYAFRADQEAEIVQIAAKAYEEMFQKPCRFRLSGGSIPIVVDLVKASGAEAALMGFALPEDNIHAPNEHFGLDRFEMGFLTMGRIIALLSEKK